jgi:hypothetical protein
VVATHSVVVVAVARLCVWYEELEILQYHIESRCTVWYAHRIELAVQKPGGMYPTDIQQVCTQPMYPTQVQAVADNSSVSECMDLSQLLHGWILDPTHLVRTSASSACND